MQNITLTPDQVVRLQRVRRLAQRMDAQWAIAGVRIGYDSLVGLIPGLGDVLTALISLSIINDARKLGVPRTLLGRMLFNVAAEMFVGEIPVLGDVADVMWRANLRNVAIIEQYFKLPDTLVGELTLDEVPKSFPLWLGGLLLLLAIMMSVAVGSSIWLMIFNTGQHWQQIIEQAWWR